MREYVKRVMRLKGLTQKDVETLSGKAITEGYVASIVTGRAENLSVKKLLGLAKGLGVDVVELFHVACGLPDDSARRPENDFSHEALAVLEIAKELVMSPDLREIMQELRYATPEHRAAILSVVKNLRRFDDQTRSQKKLS